MSSYLPAFAPVGILRAAAWSIDCLNQFGDVTLAALAAQVIPATPSWQAYLTVYNRVLEQEREVLWQLTAADRRFMKALRLSNPIVAEKVKGVEAKQPRSKTIRRLENTLYRYLARAVGRTTPNGLWAGVSSIQFDEQMTQETTIAQYAFSPDLRPFQTLLRSLACQPVYRETAQWQINPTLSQSNQNAWHFWQRTKLGQVERRELESDELLNQLLTGLIRLNQGTITELLSGLENISSNLNELELRSLLYIFIDNGLLLGGVDLPNHFDTPWSALELAAQQLHKQHQSTWLQTIEQLKHICSTLDTTIEEIALNEFEQHLTQAATCVTKLADTFEVELQLPDPLLHCDLTSPFQVSLDRTQQATLLKTLTSYETHWLDRVSPFSALRHQQRKQLACQLENDVALANYSSQVASQSWTSALTESAPEVDSEIRTRIEAWTKLLSQPRSQVTLDLDAEPLSSAKAPFGCLYITPFESFELIVRGIDDDPVRAFARFWQCEKVNKNLSIWFQHQLTQLAQQCHLAIAEIHSPFEANPNVLARPNFGIPSLNLWSTHQDTLSTNEAKMGLDPISRLPCLKLPTLPQPVAVFWFSAANINATDPIAATLLYTSFQERPIATPASTVPVAIELESPRLTPRVCLPEGTVIRPRRTVFSGAKLQEMAQTLPVERYAQWQQLAIEQEWTELLTLQIDSEPPLLMRRDSPLALEALFKSVRDKTQWLIVEEFASVPWLTDSHGQHYLSEMAFPFQRSEHGWSCRLSQTDSTREI